MNQIGIKYEMKSKRSTYTPNRLKIINKNDLRDQDNENMDLPMPSRPKIQKDGRYSKVKSRYMPQQFNDANLSDPINQDELN